jgi:hypothetical protein
MKMLLPSLYRAFISTSYLFLIFINFRIFHTIFLFRNTFNFFNIFLLIYFIFSSSIIDYTGKMYHDGVFFFYLYSVYIIFVLVIRHVVNIYLFFYCYYFFYNAFSNIDNLLVFLTLYLYNVLI